MTGRSSTSRAAKGKPTRFAFELLVDDTIYKFAFSLNRRVILEEKLVVINSISERELYTRHGDTISFDQSLKKDQFLQFAFKGTRENQFFLTNAVSQKVENFRPVYEWFKNTLELVAPDSRFEPFEQFLDDDHPLYATMNAMLPQLDTGIANLGGVPRILLGGHFAGASEPMVDAGQQQ